jgi:hypothetical protein
MAEQQKEQESTVFKKKNEQARQYAEYKYVGDDGGRWLFERRSDGLCITVDKPKDVPLNIHSRPMSVNLTVRGKCFNENILNIVRQ